MAQKVDDDSARLILMELAEAFSVSNFDTVGLLPLATEGRVYLEEGKAVLKFFTPLKLENGSTLDSFAMRVATQQDYEKYAVGLKVVSTQNGTEIDAVSMEQRTSRAVSLLSGQPLGVVTRIPRSDFIILTEVCKALRFFD